MINTESSNEGSSDPGVHGALEVKALLLQALNKNTVSYSNVSNMASSLSNGMMNIAFDVSNKSMIFQQMIF